jgi:hypothetical protein
LRLDELFWVRVPGPLAQAIALRAFGAFLPPAEAGLGSFWFAYPALKCWAIIKRPLRGRNHLSR